MKWLDHLIGCLWQPHPPAPHAPDDSDTLQDRLRSGASLVVPLTDTTVLHLHLETGITLRHTQDIALTPATGRQMLLHARYAATPRPDHPDDPDDPDDSDGPEESAPEPHAGEDGTCTSSVEIELTPERGEQVGNALAAYFLATGQ